MTASPTGEESDQPSRLVRDVVTHAGYGVLGTWAWFLYGFGAVLPLLRIEEGISRSVLALHSVALAAGSAVAGSLSLRLVRRLRRRGVLVLGALGVCAGAVMLVATRQPVLTILAAGVAGTGGSMLINAAMPALSDHHRGASAAALSEGNAVAAGVGVLAPSAIGAAVALGWTWRPGTLLVIPLAAGLLLLLRRVPAGTAAVDGELPRQSAAGRLSTTARVLVAVLVFCVAVEFCATAWSADLLRTRTGLSPAAASAGVTAVVGGMAVGRVVIGRLSLGHSARRLLLAALAVTAGGWLVTWLAVGPVPALIGLTMMGLGIAGHYPLGASLLYAATPGQADRATGRLALGIAFAAGGGPFMLGAIADATSTHTAFLAVPVLTGLAAAALLASFRASGGAI